MSLTESDKAVLKDFRWAMNFHLNCEDRGILVHRCEGLKCTRHVVTPKTNGHWGLGVVTYTVDGCDDELKTVDELIGAIKKAGYWPIKETP